MTGICRHEVHVRRAAAEDQWTDALREHVKTCADCAAAAAATPYMKRLAAIDERKSKLPDPSVLWLKAQLLRGTAIAERATRPLSIIQIAAYLIVGGSWAGILTWRWPDMERWLLGFTPASVVQGMAENAPSSLTFFFAMVVLVSMTVMLALHTILAED